jgi:uncharacterized membrane protein
MISRGLVKDVVLIACIVILAVTTAYGMLRPVEVKRVPGIQVESPPGVAVSAVKVYFKGGDAWVDVTVKNTSRENMTMLVEVTAYGSTVVLRDLYEKPGLLAGREKTVSAQYVAKSTFPEQITVKIKRT